MKTPNWYFSRRKTEQTLLVSLALVTFLTTLGSFLVFADTVTVLIALALLGILGIFALIANIILIRDITGNQK